MGSWVHWVQCLAFKRPCHVMPFFHKLIQLYLQFSVTTTPRGRQLQNLTDLVTRRLLLISKLHLFMDSLCLFVPVPTLSLSLSIYLPDAFDAEQSYLLSVLSCSSKQVNLLQSLYVRLLLPVYPGTPPLYLCYLDSCFLSTGDQNHAH